MRTALPFAYTSVAALVLACSDITAPWQSSDENVAVVRNGLVRGLSGGQTRIVATWGGYQSTAVVNVIAPWKKHDNPPVCLKRTWRAGQLRMTQC